MTLWLQSAKKAARSAVPRSATAHRTPLLHWLVNLGGLGLFGVAIVDSSVIPLPLPGSTDLLLLLMTAPRRTTVVLAAWLAFCAFAGSMVGGYLTWGAGRKGGEVTMERYVPKRYLAKITGWVQKHGAWSIGLAAILPPPVPLTPFLLAAGALGVKRGRFLFFYGIARAVRYGLLAWLGMTYGRRFVTLWQRDLKGWTAPVLWTYGSLVVLGIGYGIWKSRRARQSSGQAAVPAQDVA